jgi:hypothetical protein
LIDQTFDGWLPGAESLPSRARDEVNVSAGDGGGGVGVGVGVGNGVGVGVGGGGLSMIGAGDDAQPPTKVANRSRTSAQASQGHAIFHLVAGVGGR